MKAVATLILKGDCNRCGACCTTGHPKHGLLKCEYLKVEEAQAVGQEDATTCTKYNKRYDGMPIRMQDAQGIERIRSTCLKDSVAEVWAIVQHGLGKGCVLEPEIGPVKDPSGAFLDADVVARSGVARPTTALAASKG